MRSHTLENRNFSKVAYLLVILWLLMLSCLANARVPGADNIQNPELRVVWSRILAPVVAGRERYVEVEEVKSGSQDAPYLVVRSIVQDGRVREIAGEYRVRIDNESATLRADASDIDQKYVRDGHHAYSRITGTFRLAPKMLLPSHQFEAQGSFRSFLRADPSLHPQTAPVLDPKTITLSHPQQQVMKQLEAFDREAAKTDHVTRSLVLMPTGLGKTVIAIKRVEDRWKRQRPSQRSRVVLVLQDTEVLREIGGRFETMLNLEPGRQTFIQPNNLNRADLVRALNDPRMRAFFVTRSFAAANADLFDREAQRTPLDLIMDEAHHVGNYADDETRSRLRDFDREAGEFQRFLEVVVPSLRPGSQLLGLSGTPWHKDSDLLERYFGGNLATAFVSELEKADFVRHRDYVNLSRTATLRAIAQGYLAPIYDYRQILYLDDRTSTSEFLKRSGEINISRYDFERDSEAAKRQITIHRPFVRKIFQDIEEKIAAFDHGAGNFMRGMIFVPSIAHANMYARILNEMAGTEHVNVQFQAYHSELDEDPRLNQEKRTQTINWLQDMSVVSGKRGRKTGHKYILVVRALTEGFDMREMNHIWLARNYSNDDLVGMRMLLQAIGRGLRISPYKTKLWITDASGRLADLLFREVDPLLLTQVVVRPLSVVDPTLQPTKTVVKNNAVKGSDFVSREIDAQQAIQEMYRGLSDAEVLEKEAQRILNASPNWYRTTVVPNSYLPIFAVHPSSLRQHPKFITDAGTDLDGGVRVRDILPFDEKTKLHSYRREDFRRDFVPSEEMRKRMSPAQFNILNNKIRGLHAIFRYFDLDDRYSELLANPPNRQIPLYPESFDITKPAPGSEFRVPQEGDWDRLLDLYELLTPRVLESSFLTLLSDHSPRGVLIRYSLLLTEKPTVVDIALAVNMHRSKIPIPLVINAKAADPVTIRPDFVADAREMLVQAQSLFAALGLPAGQQIDRKLVTKVWKKKLAMKPGLMCGNLFSPIQ